MGRRRKHPNINDPEFQRHREATVALAMQLYKEAVGRGFKVTIVSHATTQVIASKADEMASSFDRLGVPTTRLLIPPDSGATSPPSLPASGYCVILSDVPVPDTIAAYIDERLAAFRPNASLGPDAFTAVFNHNNLFPGAQPPLFHGVEKASMNREQPHIRVLPDYLILRCQAKDLAHKYAYAVASACFPDSSRSAEVLV